MHKIVDNLTRVSESVKMAAIAAHRTPSDILLLAVSKTRPPEDIKAAFDAGQRDFGENYVQEAVEKIESLKNHPIIWHYIGPIQSNKTKTIAEHFAWVHTVDRRKIADRLNAQRPSSLPPVQICVQVNIDHQETKAGCTPADALALCEHCQTLPNVQLRGLMAIPGPDNAEQAFADLKALFDNLNKRLKHPMDTLSMGMSGDMVQAIHHGATIVRIGTAIFGPRTP